MPDEDTIPLELIESAAFGIKKELVARALKSRVIVVIGIIKAKEEKAIWDPAKQDKQKGR